MVHEGGLDLTRLDPDTIDLKLVIRTPQIVDLPVRTPPGQISSAIQLPTHVRSKRVRNEALRRQFGTIQVSSRDTFAPDVELANHADRNQLVPAIQNVNHRVSQRPPNRHRLVASSDPMNHRINRSLARSVPVPESSRPFE